MKDLPYKVITPKQIVEPAKRWCEERLGERWVATQNRNGKWCVFWAGSRSKNPGTYEWVYEWFFKNDKDALLFALRWL
jgi:hypothetical protein